MVQRFILVQNNIFPIIVIFWGDGLLALNVGFALNLTKSGFSEKWVRTLINIIKIGVLCLIVPHFLINFIYRNIFNNFSLPKYILILSKTHPNS